MRAQTYIVEYLSSAPLMNALIRAGLICSAMLSAPLNWTHKYIHLLATQKLIHNFQRFVNRRRHFSHRLVNCQRLALAAKHSASNLSSVWAATSCGGSLSPFGRPDRQFARHYPTYLLSRKGEDKRREEKSSTKRRHYLLTVLFRHPPVAVAPRLHGKMAATTAVWMTDQGREAEAAGERGEGAGSVNPAEGWR